MPICGLYVVFDLAKVKTEFIVKKYLVISLRIVILVAIITIMSYLKLYLEFYS